MHVKDIVASKFSMLALHMLTLCVCVYARDANIYAGLALDADLSSSSVEDYRKQ